MRKPKSPFAMPADVVRHRAGLAFNHQIDGSEIAQGGRVDYVLEYKGSAMLGVSPTMNWFQAHVYIAAWASPIIALVGLIIRNTIRPADRVNWSMIIIYVVCLTCLAAVLTPGIELAVRWLASTIGAMAFGYIAVDAMWKR